MRVEGVAEPPLVLPCKCSCLRASRGLLLVLLPAAVAVLLCLCVVGCSIFALRRGEAGPRARLLLLSTACKI